MSKIHSLLSCHFNPDGTPFTDEDIIWIENTLGLKNGFDNHQIKVLRNLDNLDVEACPGSGKTTVLVAKLALLARYWKPKSQGICVLSMTNAAREEIQERLGNTAEGQKLLHPPHFIGTIHSFFSDFLAKPYLNSNNMAIVSIDDKFCRSQRRKTLQKKQYLELTDYLLNKQVKAREDTIDKAVKKNKTQTKTYEVAKNWLDKHHAKTLAEQRLGVPVYWKMVDTEFNVLTDKGKPLDIPEGLVPTLQNVVKEVVKKGIFSFSDIFIYSQALMDTSPKVYEVIRTRFPLLLVDEAQDTSCSQAEMIHKLFISEMENCSKKTVRQRFGDANQTIYTFEPPMKEEGVDPYPSNQIQKLTIPVSHRFDESIATLASRFETNPLSICMKGQRILDKKYNHCVFIFNEDTRSNVIPAFADFVVGELDSDLLSRAKVRVCSHIQKEQDEDATTDSYARTIADYYSKYVPDKLTKEYQQHEFFLDYVNHSRFLVKETRHVGQGLEKLAEGLYKACLLSEDKSAETFASSPFHKIKSSSEKHRAIKRLISETNFLLYMKASLKCLVHVTSLNKEIWNDFIAVVDTVLNELVHDSVGGFAEMSFFKWIPNSRSSTPTENENCDFEEKGNVYRHSINNDNSFLDLKLGTIHSVKGQTHTATLLLESTHNGPVFGQLKSYILGNEPAEQSNDTQKSWLNTLYVGLTRPTHLVCIALPEYHMRNAKSKPIIWEPDDIESLKQSGWKVAKVQKGGGIDFI